MSTSSFFSGGETPQTDVYEDEAKVSALAAAQSATASATSAQEAAAHAAAALAVSDSLDDEVEAAQSNAAAAGVSAANAATSATNAANSASAANTSSANANTRAAEAALSASSASSSASAASSSAIAAATSATNASGSAATATTKASEASASAGSAGTSATNAANSASSAASSASTATTKASEASTSATNAATNATAASGSATSASGSATAAAGSATAASGSATAAAGSATAASGSATAASTAQTAAESARDATLAAFDSFDDRYLGSKTTNPTLDNDGNALVAGSLYFNSVAGEMRVYTGSVWAAAYVSSAGVLMIANNLSDLASAPTARTNLGLGNVENKSSATIRGEISSSNVTTALGYTPYNATNPSGYITSSALTPYALLSGAAFTGNVTTTGNVGIGTASPTTKLTVNNGAITAGASGDVLIGRFSADFPVGAGYFRLRTNNTNGSNGGITFDTLLSDVLTERMRINELGEVAIGTTNTGYGKLAVFDSTNSVLAVANSTSYAQLQQNGADLYINYNQSGAAGGNLIYRSFAGAETMRIDSSGRVGIGTSSPAYPLQVRRAGGAGSLGISIDGVGATDRTVQYFAVQDDAASVGSGHAFYYRAPSSTTDTLGFMLDEGGNLGVGTSSPSSKLDVRGVVSGIVASGAAFSAIRTSDFYYNNILADGFDTYTAANGSAPMLFRTGGSERMRIAPSGELLIGSTDVFGKLTLRANADSALDTWIRNDSAGSSARAGIVLNASGNSWRMGMGSSANNGNALTWNVDIGGANTERMRLTTGGNFGIGTSSPATKFAVSNGGAAGLEFDPTGGIGGGSFIQSYNRSTGSYTPNTNFASTHTWYTGATRRMDMDASGNLGIGTTSPISGAGVTVGNDGNGSGTVKYAFSTSAAERAFISLNGGSGEMRYSAGYAGYGGFSTFYTVGSERMRIDSIGLVGIGTTPLNDSSLQVQLNAGSGAARYFAVNKAGNYGVVFGYDNSNDRAEINVVANAPLAFRTNNTERARIDASGNLLVGTTSTALSTTGMYIEPLGRINIGATGSSTYMGFYVNGSIVGSISTNGTITAYNTSSDVRLKDNITDADDAASLIDAIQVRKFDWKADGSHQRYGFVAQELVTVAPEAVSQPEDPEEMMGVDYSKLVPMLVKEIQSMRLRLAQLEGNQA